MRTDDFIPLTNSVSNQLAAYLQAREYARAIAGPIRRDVRALVGFWNSPSA